MTDSRDLGFVHRFEPGESDRFTVLALHGTGGDENDLVPFARRIAPGAAILSPRGKALEHGLPRFFRRLAEGVFDVPDLIARTHELAAFVSAAAERYEFDPARVIALGYSNGANIAASLMLLSPRTLAGGVLFRAMPPLMPESPPDLVGVGAFLGAGRLDPYSLRAEELARLLEVFGAEVELEWLDAGHELTPRDLDLARTWLERRAAPRERLPG